MKVVVKTLAIVCVSISINTNFNTEVSLTSIFTELASQGVKDSWVSSISKNGTLKQIEKDKLVFEV